MKPLFITAFFVAFYFFSVAQNADTTNSSLPQLFNLYDKLKNALVNDDAPVAASSAAQFVSLIGKTDVKTLSSAEQSTFALLKEKIKSNAQQISAMKKLDRQRERFASLSQEMFLLAQSLTSLPQPFYYDYCPMKKAYWLSSEKIIPNPYYGKAMPGCGNVEQIIAARQHSMQMNTGLGDNQNDTVPKNNIQHRMNNTQTNDTGMNMSDMQDMSKMDMGMPMENMSHAFSLNLPMSRDGSGTAWMPDESPMYGNMHHSGNWMYMLHYNLFFRYNNQDFTNKGSRGAGKIDAPNWLMFMGQRKAGSNGLFHFNTMFSLDAVTMGSGGYPLLFQSGEAYKGKPIVDRQHPHDLFSELSASYAQAVSKKADLFVYIAYPGEPAIGPVAFMHRPSALYNPDAPLSHHWADATHITFGVATLGLRAGAFKAEGSSFTGREPNDKRFDFDKPRFDSWSGRLSYNPSNNWALQLSHGFLKSPEELHADEDVNRTTASAIYSLPLSNNRWFNAIALWGQNKIRDHDGENALLMEGSWRKNKLAIHARYEYVQKSVEELNLDESVYGRDVLFPVNAFTLGFNFDLMNIGKARLAGGSQFTFYSAGNKLSGLYGKNPLAFEVYFRLYPSLMKM